MRIGLLGGTFDPIHLGHLIAASEVHSALHLDQVIFIPAGNPWQKSTRSITPGPDRLNLVNLAIAGDQRFSSSDIEISRSGPTYTIDTINELKQENPDNEYFLILGTDALVNLPTWHEFEKLKKLVTFVGVNRNGVLKVDLNFSVEFVKIPEIAVSATDIRKRVATGKPIKYLVPSAVEQQIEKLGLYK